MKNISLIMAMIVGLGFCVAPAIADSLATFEPPPPSCVRVESVSRKGIPIIGASAYDDIATITAGQFALTQTQVDDLHDGAYPATISGTYPNFVISWDFAGMTFSYPICWK